MRTFPRTLAVMFGLALAIFMISFAPPVHAQTKYSLLDPVRLGVGIAAYREWDMASNLTTPEPSDWRVGLPVSWEITSPLDPSVKHPFSVIGSADYGFQNRNWRFKLGGVLGLKLAGH